MSDIKLGLIARADNTGLGVQTWELYRHLKPHKTLVIDISHLNHNKQYPERYQTGDVRFLKGFPNQGEIDYITSDVDVILSCETFYNYQIVYQAKQKGVKTILQYNFEFLDYLVQNNIEMVDMLLAPSFWNYGRVPFPNRQMLPLPVDRERLPYKQRTQAKKFLHIAGTPTVKVRNGTDIVLQAMKSVSSDIELVIYSQYDLDKYVDVKDPRITIKEGSLDNYWELYGDEDVLLMPRRYGGLCLPLNEAMSLGMIPVMTDVEPQNLFLPKECLVKTVGRETLMTRTGIDCWETAPDVLSMKIDLLAKYPEKVAELSEKMNELADKISWENMLPKYQKVLEEVCRKR